MSVNQTNLNQAALNGNSASSTAKTAQLDPVRIHSSSTGGARGSERSDEVQLSSLSSKINELQPGSPEREAYLEGLRLEVASGSYDADPAATAKSIVDDSLSAGDAAIPGSGQE